LTNRISGQLEAAIADVDVNVSLTDWLLLHALKTDGSLPATKIAYKIGVTRQRIYQQMTSLISAGFVHKEEVPESKYRTLSIAPSGLDFLERTDAAIRESFVGKTGKMPADAIHNACNGARRVARGLSKQQPKAE
jgi:DNA-binding MarR family transcriptional regulator